MKQVLVFQQYIVKEDHQLHPTPLKYWKVSKVLVSIDITNSLIAIHYNGKINIKGFSKY